MKGKLPITEKIILESDESQWRLLVDGLINTLKTTALVTLEKELKTVRLNLVITRIYPPELYEKKNKCSLETNGGRELSMGLTRARLFFNNYLDKTTWLFMGYIDGENRVPILITHYHEIKITIYTQKLKVEETATFFPDPRLN